jgi:hypothetical protein
MVAGVATLSEFLSRLQPGTYLGNMKLCDSVKLPSGQTSPSGQWLSVVSASKAVNAKTHSQPLFK